MNKNNLPQTNSVTTLICNLLQNNIGNWARSTRWQSTPAWERQHDVANLEKLRTLVCNFSNGLMLVRSFIWTQLLLWVECPFKWYQRFRFEAVSREIGKCYFLIFWKNIKDFVLFWMSKKKNTINKDLTRKATRLLKGDTLKNYSLEKYKLHTVRQKKYNGKWKTCLIIIININSRYPWAKLLKTTPHKMSKKFE